MKVVHRAGKLGLGTAVVAGFGVASADIVGVMDADFSHPPALVPRMHAVFRATNADVLVASRYVPGGSTPNWPVIAEAHVARRAVWLARPLSPIRDAASGFFLIKRSIAAGVTIKAGGFKICLELIVRGWPTRLVEIPYRFDDRELGESKMSYREAAGYLVQLRDLYALRWSGPARPARDYQALSRDEVDRPASRSCERRERLAQAGSGGALTAGATGGPAASVTGAPKSTRDATCQATFHLVDVSRTTSPAWRTRYAGRR